MTIPLFGEDLEAVGATADLIDRPSGWIWMRRPPDLSICPAHARLGRRWRGERRVSTLRPARGEHDAIGDSRSLHSRGVRALSQSASGLGQVARRWASRVDEALYAVILAAIHPVQHRPRRWMFRFAAEPLDQRDGTASVLSVFRPARSSRCRVTLRCITCTTCTTCTTGVTARAPSASAPRSGAARPIAAAPAI